MAEGRAAAARPSPPPLVHGRPIHVANNASIFSNESLSRQNYNGFLHLIILLLVVNMIRLAVENYQKYGFLLSIPGSAISASDFFAASVCFLSIAAATLLSFAIERLGIARHALGSLAKRRTAKGGARAPRTASSLLRRLAIGVNIGAFFIAIPAVYVHNYMDHPLLATIILSMTVVYAMKTLSYHAVNGELAAAALARQPASEGSLARLAGEAALDDGTGADGHIVDDGGSHGWALSGTGEGDLAFYSQCSYPRNVTLGNALYFWAAPTLCYQPVYARTLRCRTSFLVKRLVEVAASLAMIHILIDQYAIPTVQNSMKPMNDVDMVSLVERLLKLSISSLFIWLLAFYSIFHSILNAFGEVLCFGDRTFYHAWWNANTIEEYWRFWNAPVHHWFKRHVYIPMRIAGYSASAAQATIFVISAIFHEYLIALPTGVTQGWALMAMLNQIPLIMLTSWYMKKYPRSRAGNYFFWIFFCILGQPMCVLLYYRAWYVKRHPHLAL